MNRALVAQSELAINLAELKTDVVLLQEPVTYKNRLIQIPSYFEGFPSRTLTTRPRAAIYAKRNLKLIELVSLQTADCAVALFRSNGLQIVIVSCYLDITNKEVITSEITNICQYAASNRFPLLLGIDTNSHSSLYGPTTNKRGEKIEEFIMTNHLQVENKGDIPTFQSSRFSTFIDATFTRDLAYSITNWRVDQSFSGSDHKAIHFSLEHVFEEVPSTRPWAKAKWDVFTKQLEKADLNFPEEISDKKLEKQTCKLYNAINQALEVACPMTKATSRDTKNPWYTEEVRTLQEEMHQAYDKWKTNGRTSVLLVSLQQARKRYRRECRKQRRFYWQKMKMDKETPKEMSELLKMVQYNDKIKINCFKKTNGEITLPGRETGEHLMKHHFPNATPTKWIIYNHNKIETKEIEKMFDEWINLDKLRNSLQGFDNKKSPGPDGLKPIIFQHLPANVLKFILLIYKSCIALEFTPKVWKATKVVYIPKPGKPAYDQPSSFRPISLSNYLLKGLERLCVWRMDVHLTKFPIHSQQHGFRSDRSTESAISYMTNYIESFVMKGQQCVGLFLDIKSAFDSISPSQIKNQLIKHGGDRSLVGWYDNYISHRDLIFEIQNTKINISNGIGFPQGGVASAKFWLIAFDPAVSIINTHGVFGNAFADDCGAALGGTHLPTIIKHLHRMIRDLVSWGRTCNLEFNPNKTVAVRFSRKKNKSALTGIQMEGTNVTFSNSALYLGVTLDHKLNWQEHIKTKIDKSKKLLHSLTHLVADNFGPKPELLLWAYTGVVRPALTYASMNWGHALEGKSIQKKLMRLDRLALLTASRVHLSTPTRGLQITYGILPLHLFIKQTGALTFARLHHLLPCGWDSTIKAKKHSIPHRRYWEGIFQKWNITLGEDDYCNNPAGNKNFQVCTDSFNGGAKFKKHTQFNLYTDGSKIEDKVGWGFVMYHNQDKTKSHCGALSSMATVFQAEIEAIRQCVIYLRSIQGNEEVRYVKIFVDSQAALLALNSLTITSKKVAETIRELNLLAHQSKSVQLVWTKAHVGTLGNELADQEAKAGANKECPAPVLPPRGHTKGLIKDNILTEWEEEWKSYPLAKETKQFFPGPNAALSKEIRKLSRVSLAHLVRITSGHNNLNLHFSRCNPGENPFCRFCGEQWETFFHWAMDCPRFISERRDIFNFYESDDDVFPKWELPMLLDFSHVLDIAMAIEDPRVEPFAEWSVEDENQPDSNFHSDGHDTDELVTQPQAVHENSGNPPTQSNGARAAGAAFRAAMEAVLNNFDNSLGPVSQSRAHITVIDGPPEVRADIRGSETTEACFNAAMETVLNEPNQRRTYVADISAEDSTQDANMHDRNNTESRSITNNSENNLNPNSHMLAEAELPDIDQPISDESYPSNSAFSFNYENENFDKTPEFEPEWDPG